jgi:hypothetical protein
MYVCTIMPTGTAVHRKVVVFLHIMAQYGFPQYPGKSLAYCSQYAVGTTPYVGKAKFRRNASSGSW